MVNMQNRKVTIAESQRKRGHMVKETAGEADHFCILWKIPMWKNKMHSASCSKEFSKASQLFVLPSRSLYPISTVVRLHSISETAHFRRVADRRINMGAEGMVLPTGSISRG